MAFSGPWRASLNMNCTQASSPARLNRVTNSLSHRATRWHTVARRRASKHCHLPRLRERNALASNCLDSVEQDIRALEQLNFSLENPGRREVALLLRYHLA